MILPENIPDTRLPRCSRELSVATGLSVSMNLPKRQSRLTLFDIPKHHAISLSRQSSVPY